MTAPGMAGRLRSLSGGFVGKTMTLVMGTGLSQGVTVLTLPVLTRVYTPEQFGVFSLYFVVVTTAALVACLCYEPAIMLPEDGTEAAAILVAAFAIAAGVGAVAAAAVWIGGDRLVAAFGADELRAPLAWAPATIVALGLSQALTYWATRAGAFGMISASRLFQTAVTAGLQIAAGTLGGGVSGLVTGFLLGQVVGTAVLATTAVVPLRRFIRDSGYGIGEYGRLLHRYRDFPLYSTWGDVMNALGFQIIPVVLSRLFGVTATGLYFLAYRVISLPMSLIGASVKQVVLQESAARVARQASITPLVERVIGRSIVLMGLPWLCLALVAPDGFSIAFGREWEGAGSYVRVLAPLGFLQLVTSPISVVLITLQKQRLVAFIQAALLLVAFGALDIGQRISDVPFTVLAVYTAAQSMVYLVYLGIVVRASSASSRAILREAMFLPSTPAVRV